MIKIFYHSVLSVLVLVFFSCANQEKETSTSLLGAPEKNEHAEYFKIYRQKNYSVLVTYLNVSKTDSAVYVLYTNKKPEIDLPAHFIKTPVHRAASFASVFTGFLNRLQIIEVITAVDNLDFVSNAMVQYLAAEGSVKELSKSGQLNIEQTLASGVEVIFTNPGGDTKKDFDKRLLDAGIVPIVCADYFENHPLGRAEWIKAMALFFNLESGADSLFAVTEKKYADLKSSVDTCKYKPTVFTEVKTNDVWFVAGGKSSAARFLADAGANYLWSDNEKTEVTALNMEQVLQKAVSADYWINLHLCSSVDELLNLDKRYAGFAAVKKRNLYNNNCRVTKTGANDYWESGLCNPDEILRDLVKIFHPALQKEHQLKYYKQLD